MGWKGKGIALLIPPVCSRPVTVSATKRVFQFFGAAISLYYLYWAYYDAQEVAKSSTIWSSPHAVRLTVLGLRDTAALPAEANAVVFGLLSNSCPIQAAANLSNSSAMVTLSVSLPEPNGYYLNIAAGGSAATDPVRWTVEALGPEGGKWLAVGASVWRGCGTLARYFPLLDYPTPESTAKGVLVAVDSRPGWPWILTEVGTYAVAGTGWGLYCVAGLTGRQRAAVLILASTFSINTLQQATAAVGYYAAADWRASVEGWMNGAAVSAMALALWIDEQLVVPSLLVFGTVSFLALVSHCCCVQIVHSMPKQLCHFSCLSCALLAALVFFLLF